MKKKNLCNKQMQQISAKEYKPRWNWMGKVICWELCQKFKSDHRNKGFMYDLESFLKNEVHKILWNFEIQTDHLILTSWPNTVIVKKKKKRTCLIVGFAIWADHKIKLKENKKRSKYQDLAWGKKKLWNIKVTIVIGALETILKGLVNVSVSSLFSVHKGLFQ